MVVATVARPLLCLDAALPALPSGVGQWFLFILSSSYRIRFLTSSKRHKFSMATCISHHGKVLSVELKKQMDYFRRFLSLKLDVACTAVDMGSASFLPFSP
ncbi:Hypothetical predicted protein [Podarcis lilfordi]|uniref:Uncharacterized protein n=1 Tax=Podarcis lilfordi TaxID=74358 RepID=A0AA35PU32_9SAUR|nr:Hypothetical predicted protein [Podarcis lilfordi]